MPSFTFYATAEAAIVAGATPVFCDIDPDTLLRDRRDREGGAHPAHEGDRARAPVRQRGAGARAARARPAGARGRGPGGRRGARRRQGRGRSATRPRSRSFPSKNLPCLGDGGAIATDDDALAERARMLRFHGSKDKSTFTEVGYNSRLDEHAGRGAARAAAGARRLERAPPRGGGRLRARWASASMSAAARRRRARGTSTTSTWCGPSAAAVGRGYYRVPGAPPAGDRRRRRPAGHRGGGAHQPRAADGHRPDRRAGARGGGGVRVWVDLTNSPHVLVMRPLIEAMRADGHEVEVTARDFAQTLELCERFGIEHTAIGRHRGGRLASKALGLASRSLALARWARGRRFDVAIGPRLQRRERGRGAAARPERHRLRLRVGGGAAPGELPPGAGGGGARRDPARAARPLRRARQAARLPGPQGGVLPGRLRARPGGARRARPRPRAAARGRAHAARGVALPPLREPALPAGARAPGRGATRRRWCCRARPRSARSCAARRASWSPSTRSTRRAWWPTPTS